MTKKKVVKAKIMRELREGSKVIGYVRVSTEEQKKNGDGLDVQIKALQNYC
jgi:predicted site-specific integrase-resolvase